MILNTHFCCQMVACTSCQNNEFSRLVKASKSAHLSFNNHASCSPRKGSTGTDVHKWRQQINKNSICEKNKTYHEECLCIGRSSDGGGESNKNNYVNNMDVYYQNKLKENPGDPLLLTNYARFLHEVVGDIRKAEEFYERGILASTDEYDGYLLCLYANFIWEAQKDPRRAQPYFERSVEASPNDCYVHASYAIFLWNSEAGDDEGYNDHDNLV